MTTLRINDVRKVYPNGAEAVKGVSVDVEEGELCVFVGPSGCGKSTLLRMVAGLESVTEGDIELAGRIVNDLEPADRNIAMVFQNYALYPHMSVRKNLAYGLRNRKTPTDEIDRRVNDAAELLQIGEFLDRRPSQLSGGQRQRVAMGRAIVRKPAIFLFDEPLSNLDAKLRNQMRLEIKKLQQSLETAAIYVTHDQVEAMTMADKIVVLNDGQVEQIGTPAEIYGSPATTFVASFIGAPPMNLLPAEIGEDGLKVGGVRLEYPTDQRGPVTFGLRPERARLGREGEGIAVDIGIVEELGAVRLVHCQLGDHDLTVAQDSENPLPSGRMGLTYVPSDALLFDRTTGRRL